MADEEVELAPPATIPTPPAIALPDEASRATASVPTSTLAKEQADALATMAHHAPTMAYRFSNVLIHDGSCFCRGAIERVGGRRGALLVMAHARRWHEAQLCLDAGAHQFFGHWLCDALCTEILASDRALPPLTMSRPDRIHEANYRNLLSLRANDATTAIVDTLWLVDDRGYNWSRIERFRRLRNRLQNAVEPLDQPLVFVDRGTSGALRPWTNRDRIVDTLVARGFSVLEPERCSAEHVARTLSGARLVVGLEGSHLNHALLALPEGAGLLAIQPANHFNMFNKTIASFANIRFGFVVADACDGGVALSPDRLLATIDLMDRQLSVR